MCNRRQESKESFAYKVKSQQGTSTLRCMANVKLAFERGKGALFIGAGVDKFLASASGKNIELPTWSELLEKLLEDGDRKIKYSEPSFINDWPTEFAMLAKIKIGKRKFHEELKRIIEEVGIAKVGGSPGFLESMLAKIKRGKWKFHEKLKRIIEKEGATKAGGSPESNNRENDSCSEESYAKWFLKSIKDLILSKDIDVIVTTNYSSHLSRAIKFELGKERRIIVIGRNDLEKFLEIFMRKDSCKKNQGNLYIVHLHGKIDHIDYPILDAWGYNIVQTEDGRYKNFLQTLLAERSVIFVGTSWKDIPLRESAAYVYRTLPYRRQDHLLLKYKENGNGNTHNGGRLVSIDRNWGCAMQACYGIKPVFVNNEEQIECINWIGSSILKSDISKLDELANALDECGDFESQQQHEILFSECKKRKDFGIKLGGLVDQICSDITENKIDWEIAARIERHVRHHLYLYNSDFKERKRLWITLWKKREEKISSRLPDDVKADFLIGGYEVGILKKDYNDYEDMWVDNELLKKRVEMSKKVWGENNFDSKSTGDDGGAKISEILDKYVIKKRTLIKELLEIGWESIAAKIATDISRKLIQWEHIYKTKNKTDFKREYLIRYIQDTAEDAIGLARAAGMRRRAVAAEVISIMWSSNLADARAEVLSRLRSLGQAERLLEYPLIDGFAAALIVNYAREHIEIKNGEHEDWENYRKEDIWSIIEDCGICIEDIDKGNINKYWVNFAPYDVKNMILGRYE